MTCSRPGRASEGTAAAAGSARPPHRAAAPDRAPAWLHWRTAVAMRPLMRSAIRAAGKLLRCGWEGLGVTERAGSGVGLRMGWWAVQRSAIGARRLMVLLTSCIPPPPPLWRRRLSWLPARLGHPCRMFFAREGTFRTPRRSSEPAVITEWTHPTQARSVGPWPGLGAPQTVYSSFMTRKAVQ